MKTKSILVIFSLSLLFLALSVQAETRWYKGNTHTHTLWSDGNDFPEMIADWYKRHGYQFLILSDHNILSRGEKWKDITGFEEKHQVVEKARKRFGDEAVETRREGDQLLAKLKTLKQIRDLLEEPERFLLIEGEEITGLTKHRPAHVNAINITEVLMPIEGSTMGESLSEACRIAKEHGQKTGKPVFCHINHPNWRYSNTAEEIAQATVADAVEVVNGVGDSRTLGDQTHVSTDQMWDIANALRILREKIPPLYGCASDDSHHYHSDEPTRANPGRAWVMVRSENLSEDAITTAMINGDFYASTGVSLEEVRYDTQTRTLHVKVDVEPGHVYRIDFVGTPEDTGLARKVVEPVIDGKGHSWPVTSRYSSRIGMTFASMVGTQASYTLTGDKLYVRAIIVDLSSGKMDWGHPEQRMEPKAWTQPVGWEKRLAH